MKIPIYKPELPPYEIVEPDIRAMYKSGMLYPGVYTERLNEKIRSYCGVSYVLPVSSCSLGLILMLNTLPQGTKVILPSFTFNATLQALEWNGLTPVVVDVDENGQLCSSLVRDAIEENSGEISAVVGVHMWGNLLDTKEFGSIGYDTGVSIFYDGAHALGSFENSAINPGDATCFSIAATKPVSAGEGGLIVTNLSDLYYHLRDAAFHGKYDSLDTRVRGINGKIQEFNSILAYHALNRFEETRRRRREIFDKYTKELEGLPLRIWKARDKVSASYKDCVIFLEDKPTRDSLDFYLQDIGIGTKRYFEPAVPDMGNFRGIVHSADRGRFLASRCLTIPLYPSLTDKEVEFIISVIRKFFGKEI